MTGLIEAQRFNLLFKGKNDSYVWNNFPKEKPEEGVKIKTDVRQVSGEVNSELLVKHLEGDFAVGVCPVQADGKCFFGVIDIDYYKDKILKVLDFIKEYQLPLLPFRSKSGGLHLYLFVRKSVSAKSMRETLSKIVYYFCLDSLYGDNKVEIFPKQDKAKGFGSCITLPYFNAEDTYNYLMSLDGEPVSFDGALNIIKQSIVMLEDVQECLDRLPYGDAPPCLQRILLSGVVGGDDSGRNNFLFSYSVYAKKKYGTGFCDYVRKINNSFASPLEDTVIDSITASVTENEYVYKCKDIPCKGFCNKSECSKREFGLGRNKGHFTGIDYGQMYRYMTAEPYYVWLLRLHGQEEWKKVIFKDEGYLLDQKNFAKLCIRYLNSAPLQVSNNDWYAVLNTVLPNITEVEVKQEADTSGKALLRTAFLSYLSNKMAHNDRPYQIHVGLCVRQKVVEDGAYLYKYYFTHQGFTEFLKNQKISFDASLLRETLLSFGAEEDVLVYMNAVGEERRCRCWSKVEDKDINEAYSGILEVEEGDKYYYENSSVSEASNTENREEEIKPYTEEDMKNAEEMF